MTQMLKALGIIHFGVASGPILLLAVSYYLIGQDPSHLSPMELDNPLVMAAIFMGLSAAPVSFMLPKFFFAQKTHDPGAALNQAPEKYLTKYNTAKIIQFLVLEGPALLNGVVYYLSGNYVNLALGAVLVVILVAQRPSKTDFAKLTGLDETRL